MALILLPRQERQGTLAIFVYFLLIDLCRSSTSSKIHPIFEQNSVHQTPADLNGNNPAVAQYEIKSCLSPDLEIHERTTCKFYALMIDAGSTGTRIHIFEFSHDTQNKAAPFKLDKETFAEVKPGLSSYTNSYLDAGKSIEPLINKAKMTVPKNLWSHTPLALKATAGVRLLNADQAEAIMNSVEDVLRNTPFLTNEDSATIMTGTDEGIFGWFTLNFLLDRLYALTLKPEELLSVVHDKLTAAALDLGGGSTQVTFRPRLSSTKENAPDDFLKEIRLFGQNVELYTHSYLGNGLMAARLSALKLANIGAHRKFYTSCLPPDYQIRWNYSDSWLNIKGNQNYSFENCLSEYERFVESCNVDKPGELPVRDIYAFGYYFDRGFQAELVSVKGGHVTVGDFEMAARKACNRHHFGKHHWEPWQCTDLTYILALWKTGYNLSSDKQIFLTKKLRQMETSWALGASYHLLNTYHESNSRSKRIDENSDAQARGALLQEQQTWNVSSVMNDFYGSFLSNLTSLSVSCVYSKVYDSVTSWLAYFQLVS